MAVGAVDAGTALGVIWAVLVHICDQNSCNEDSCQVVYTTSIECPS